jgi:hypothetical protein
MSEITVLEPGTRLFLHACCGPCTEYPARQLLGEGVSVLAWYYNPNIHPLQENRRRRDNLIQAADRIGISCLTEEGCDPEPWLALQDDPAARCVMCYAARLGAAARKARQMGYAAFSTTLLVSPWQNHELIRSTGREMAAACGLQFYYRDFRDGYRAGQQWARADGLYRQRYCGCLPSLGQSAFKEKILRELAELAE